MLQGRASGGAGFAVELALDAERRGGGRHFINILKILPVECAPGRAGVGFGERDLALGGLDGGGGPGGFEVAGAGFITLAATLAVVPEVPVAGMALILGVDRFMSECRSLTNFIGNAVATVVVSRWEGALDRDRLKLALDGRENELPPPVDAVPEALPAKG